MATGSWQLLLRMRKFRGKIPSAASSQTGQAAARAQGLDLHRLWDEEVDCREGRKCERRADEVGQQEGILAQDGALGARRGEQPAESGPDDAAAAPHARDERHGKALLLDWD
eukprot:6195518-Pleurochrysis_carterae.AAC.1